MLTGDPLFKTYALCSCVLTLEMLFLGGYTAGARAKHRGYTNPEDHRVSFRDARLVEGGDHPDVARISRAHRNLLESLPMFFALGLLCVLTRATPTLAAACIGIFTAARIVHAIVYIRGLQPWRTISYGVGALALVGMIVQIVLAVL